MDTAERRALACRQHHAGLNDFIAERGGWLVSIPGRAGHPIRGGAGFVAARRSAPSWLRRDAGRHTKQRIIRTTATITLTEVYELTLPPEALP